MRELRNQWLELDMVKTGYINELDSHGIEYNEMSPAKINVKRFGGVGND